MEYLDRPALDGTPKAHPAFWRGKAAGINEMLKIVADIMMNNDNGTGVNSHEQVERMRRALIVWREELDKVKPHTDSKKKEA